MSACEDRLQFNSLDGEVAGFDISGFSRFAEERFSRDGHSTVDDIARLWEHAVAPQIDRLIAGGYEVADVCGDGVVMFRPSAESGETEGLLADVARGFAASAPGLSLRTAHRPGQIVFADVEALGERYKWITGADVQTLHAQLCAIPRRVSEPTPAQWSARDDVLASVWSQSGAELRVVATLFIRLAPQAWLWTDAERVTDWVRSAAAAAAENQGRLEKVTHDDKGLLLRCVFAGGSGDPLVNAAAAARSGLRLADGAGAGFAVCEGLVYRGPLRIGAVQHLTIHGAAVNLAAKTAASTIGLVVLAPTGGSRAARLRAAGLEPAPDGRSWRPAAADCRAVVEPDAAGGFVGREAQLARLAAAMQCAGASTNLVIVESEIGYGKTALTRRFAATLQPGQRAVSAGAAPSDGLHGPWPKLLRSLIEAEFGSLALARQPLAMALAQQGLLDREFPILSQFGLELFPASEYLRGAEPAEIRRLLDCAFHAILQTTASRGDSAIIVEDVHWLGPEGWRWVEICLQAAGRRLLVLTRRTGASAPTVQQGRVLSAWRGQHVQLGGLRADEASSLVKSLRPDLADRAATLETMVTLAAGVPLLVDQLARAWPNPGRPEFDHFGHTLAARDVGGEPLSDPDLLERVLDVRLDRLGVEETEILRLLAVEARPAAIEHLWFRGEPVADAARLTRRLQQLGFVQRSGAAFGLRHALIGEAIGRRMPRLLHRTLHARAARRLAHDASSDAAVIGAHWREAEAPLRAVAWTARAAARAEAAGALRAAADLYDQVLETCPKRLHGGARALNWRARLAGAAFGIGDLGRAQTEAASCVKTASEGRRAHGRREAAQRRALLVRAEVATFTADVGGMIDSLVRLRRLGRGHEDGLHGREAGFSAYVLALLRAGPLADAWLDSASRHGQRDRYYTYASRGLIHSCFARWDPAELALKEAMALAGPQTHPHENEIAVTLLALGRYFRGDNEASLALFRGIRDAGVRRDNSMHEAWGLYGAAQALIALGRLDEATDQLDRAEALLDGHLDRQSRLICSGLRVELAVRRGDQAAVLDGIEANLRQSGRMPVSNFGSFEGYCASPTAALLLLSQPDLPGATRAALEGHAKVSIKMLGRYSAIFPLGRPRLNLCRALGAAARGDARTARRFLGRGLSFAKRYGMQGESNRLRAALDSLPQQERTRR